MYIYRTQIYKNPNSIIGAPIDAGDLAEFEGTYKAQAVPVSGVVVAETSFVIDNSWDVFKARIVSPLSWSDVKYTEEVNRYEMVLVTENPI